MRGRVAVLALVFAFGTYIPRPASAQVVTPVVSRLSSGWWELDRIVTFDDYDPHLSPDDVEDRDIAVQTTLPGILIALLLGGGSRSGVTTSPGLPGGTTGGGGANGGGGNNSGGGSNGGGGNPGGNPGGASVPEPGLTSLAGALIACGAVGSWRLRIQARRIARC